MEYTSTLLWFASWPLVIYVSYRFVRFNIDEIMRREKKQ